jgi:hypothetical protein
MFQARDLLCPQCSPDHSASPKGKLRRCQPGTLPAVGSVTIGRGAHPGHQGSSHGPGQNRVRSHGRSRQGMARAPSWAEKISGGISPSGTVESYRRPPEMFANRTSPALSRPAERAGRRPISGQNGRGADRQRLRLLTDIVAKVENRTTLKISRKLIFRHLCIAFQRHYAGP